MTKLLNLDSFVTPERQVTIRGATYNLHEQTVESYLRAQKLQADYEKMSDTERLEASIGLLAASIDGISIDELKRLNFDQINVLTQFVSGVDEPTLGNEGAEGDQKKA